MILVIFSYVKSAIVFSFMTLAVAAGIAATCLYTQATVDFVLRIAGLCVLFIASYAASCAYAVKLVDSQCERMGNNECKIEELSVRLRKLAKRAYFGSVRGMISVQYAYALLCLGKYREAEIAASDAIVAAGDGAKADASILFCKAYYMLGDEKYFAINYPKAINALEKYCESKNKSVSDSACAGRAAIEAMRLSLSGDNDAALDRLNGFCAENMPPLLQRNIIELKKHMQSKKDAA